MPSHDISHRTASGLGDNKRAGVSVVAARHITDMRLTLPQSTRPAKRLYSLQGLGLFALAVIGNGPGVRRPGAGAIRKTYIGLRRRH